MFARNRGSYARGHELCFRLGRTPLKVGDMLAALVHPFVAAFEDLIHQTFEPRRIEPQTIEHRGRKAGGAGIFQILRIGGKDLRRGLPDAGGTGAQGRGLLPIIAQGQRPLGPAPGTGQIFHQRLMIVHRRGHCLVIASAGCGFGMGGHARAPNIGARRRQSRAEKPIRKRRFGGETIRSRARPTALARHRHHHG